MNGFINFQYWVFVTFLLSGVFMSTADGYSSALMLSVATLPGVITAKFFIEDVSGICCTDNRIPMYYPG